jgi:predicted double-glycine peptidase
VKVVWRKTLAFGLLAILAACSTPEQFKGVKVGETPTLITSIPPLLQTKQVSCGPTSVAAVAAYWGKDYSILISNSYPFLAEDHSAAELTNLVQKVDLKAFAYRSSLDDLKNQIQNGRPVLVLISRPHYEHSPNLALNGVPIDTLWDAVAPKNSHWVICIGFTESKMVIQDPARGRMAVSFSKFDSWWEARKRTCVLIVP